MPEPLTAAEIAEVREVLHERRELRERNLRILKHEAETFMRDHDPDGACCRAAIYEEPTR